MTPQREYGLVLGSLAAAAAIMLAALGQVWLRATASGGQDQPRIVLTYTGRELVPVAAGAAILLLAGVAGVIATKRLGRSVVGVVLVLAAVAAGGATLSWGLSASAAGRERAIADAGVEDIDLSGSWWWLVVVVCSVAALAAALAVVLRGRRWPVLGGRYERPGTASGRPDVVTPAQAWDALDRGEDPTRTSEVSE
jgi:uncharacterized membrane protein (TIGR02234 family)